MIRTFNVAVLSLSGLLLSVSATQAKVEVHTSYEYWTRSGYEDPYFRQITYCNGRELLQDFPHRRWADKVEDRSIYAVVWFSADPAEYLVIELNQKPLAYTHVDAESPLSIEEFKELFFHGKSVEGWSVNDRKRRKYRITAKDEWGTFLDRNIN